MIVNINTPIRQQLLACVWFYVKHGNVLSRSNL